MISAITSGHFKSAAFPPTSLSWISVAALGNALYTTLKAALPQAARDPNIDSERDSERTPRPQRRGQVPVSSESVNPT